MKIWIITFCVVVGYYYNCFADDISIFISIAKPEEVSTRIDGDETAFLTYRDGLGHILKYMEAHPKIFLSKKFTRPRVLKPQIRKEILTTWQSFLDFYLALDSLSQFYENCDMIEDKQLKADSFILFYSSFLTEYRYALEFINIIENDPGLDTILNEPVVELGLPSDTYKQFKNRFLNLIPAMKFASSQALYGIIPSTSTVDLNDTIDEDAAVVWKMGFGVGEMLTLSNFLSTTKSVAYFPVKAGLTQVLTTYKSNPSNTITDEQINQLSLKLEPGDIILERKEDAISVIGIPGFWTHAALYIGTPEERNKYFDDPDVDSLLMKKSQYEDIEAYLSAEYPESYQESLKPTEDNYTVKVIEAVTKGVSFVSIEHSKKYDCIAVLRPTLSKKDKAEAIKKAFSSAGKQYDFDFDFLTDSTLCCSELVYKAYEAEKHGHGLDFKLQDIAGRMLLSPNDIAQQFDEQYGTKKQQMEFVAFLEGNYKGSKAVELDMQAFRSSWHRPKWHLAEN